MINRSGHDLRFGAANPATFGTLPDWDPSWELRWMNFTFTAGHQVTIYHITNKSNSSIRYTIFIDPDTGTWTNWEQALGPIDEQAIHDMVKRAAADPRFGVYIAGTFGTHLAWDPSWELRWINFNFSGGRVVQMYHATYKFDSSLRYTIYWDPDTNNWINIYGQGWVQAQ
jgi:hypothetical protein